VAAVLAPKAIRMPSATGTSMPMVRWRRSRQALAKNGRHENSITGKVSTQEAQRSSCAASAVISPGSATYAGKAYIMTCIMQKPATSQRHSMVRCARARTSRWARSVAGRAW
jgi:hypothetical protein